MHHDGGRRSGWVRLFSIGDGTTQEEQLVRLTHPLLLKCRLLPSSIGFRIFNSYKFSIFSISSSFSTIYSQLNSFAMSSSQGNCCDRCQRRPKSHDSVQSAPTVRCVLLLNKANHAVKDVRSGAAVPRQIRCQTPHRLNPPSNSSSHVWNMPARWRRLPITVSGWRDTT